MHHWITVNGHCPSIKNTMRVSKSGHVFRRQDAQKEIDALIMQAKAQWNGRPPLENPGIMIQQFVRDMRSDPNNQWATIFDVLVRAGVLKDDNAKRCNGPFYAFPVKLSTTGREQTRILLFPEEQAAAWGLWLHAVQVIHREELTCGVL